MDITPAYTTVEGVHEGGHFGPRMCFIPACECGNNDFDLDYAGCASDGTFDTDAMDYFACRLCGRVMDVTDGSVVFQYDVDAADVRDAFNVYGLEMAGM